MMHLLESKTLFAFSEPSCYVQLTGSPVYELTTDRILRVNVNQTDDQNYPHIPNSVRLKRKHQSSKHTNWRVKKKKMAVIQLVESKKRKDRGENNELLRASEGRRPDSQTASSTENPRDKHDNTTDAPVRLKRSSSKAELDDVERPTKKRRRSVSCTEEKGRKRQFESLVSRRQRAKVAKQKAKPRTSER